MNPLIELFRESMIMDHGRWHDGTGYRIDLFGSATPEELAQIESLLTSRSIHGWRDVEALYALGTQRTRDCLREAFDSGDVETRAMITSYAPEVIDDEERSDAIVAALENEVAESRLVGVMLEVEEFHPPRVIQALLRGVRTRDAITAGEFAMMLLFIHGKAESPWDMAPRPFILRFQDEERGPLFLELCERIGVSPESRP